MLIAVTTGRTSKGSVARVNRNNTHSCTSGLVLDKFSQLIESPISKLKTHFSSEVRTSVSVHNRSPLSNPTKVFKSDCLTRDSRQFDKATADIVIHPTSEPRLTMAQLLKVTLRRLRTMFFSRVLEPCFELSHSATQGADGLTAVLVAFAVRSNLNNAKVSANKLSGFVLRSFCNVTDHHQIELTVDKAKIAFALLSQKHLFLKLSSDKRNLHSSCNCPERNLAFLSEESQYSGIVGDRTRGAKVSLSELIQLVRISDFGVAPDNQLRSQRELLTDIVITGFVQVKRLEAFVFPCMLRHTIASLVRLFKCGEKDLLLLVRGKELDLSNEFHYRVTPDHLSKTERREKTNLKTQSRELPCDSRFLPRLNAQSAPRVSSEVFL